MKLANWLYGFLSSHQQSRQDPFWEKRRPWTVVCIWLLHWLFAERISLEVKVAQLTKLLGKAEEKGKYIKRVLVAAEKQGELSFSEALEVSGVWSDPGVDPYARFYDESKTGCYNPFADMGDEDFFLLECPIEAKEVR